MSILFCIRTPKQSPFTPVLKVRLRGRNFCVGEAPKISFYLKEKSSAATGSASSAWWHVPERHRSCEPVLGPKAEANLIGVPVRCNRLLFLNATHDLKRVREKCADLSANRSWQRVSNQVREPVLVFGEHAYAMLGMRVLVRQGVQLTDG